MKQTSFIIEVVLKEDVPVIIVRDPRSGMVIKICKDSSELATFCEEMVERLKNVPGNHE